MLPVPRRIRMANGASLSSTSSLKMGSALVKAAELTAQQLLRRENCLVLSPCFSKYTFSLPWRDISRWDSLVLPPSTFILWVQEEVRYPSLLWGLIQNGLHFLINQGWNWQDVTYRHPWNPSARVSLETMCISSWAKATVLQEGLATQHSMWVTSQELSFQQNVK